MKSVHHAEYGVPKDNIYLVYITYTDDMVEAVDLFVHQSLTLIHQYETEDRLLTYIRCPWCVDFIGAFKLIKTCFIEVHKAPILFREKDFANRRNLDPLVVKIADRHLLNYPPSFLFR